MLTKLKYGFYLLGISILMNSCEEDSPTTTSDCPLVIQAEWEEEYTNDYILINSVSVQNQELNLNVSHSGGCEDHDYQVIQDPLFCGTPPIYISIRISHESNNDPCEAWITEDLCFDMSSIYDAFPNDVITIGLYNTHQTDTTWVIE